jgi:uncharacterized tellurite resistance protein B-like protein
LRVITKFPCRMAGCPDSVPPALTQEALCLEHYLDGAMHQLEIAAALCREGHPIQEEALDQLQMQAEFAVQFLADGSGDDSSSKKEQLLQFLLGLANLHQYLSHHASLVGKPN